MQQQGERYGEHLSIVIIVELRRSNCLVAYHKSASAFTVEFGTERLSVHPSVVRHMRMLTKPQNVRQMC
jgi:hypothetical protein